MEEESEVEEEETEEESDEEEITADPSSALESFEKGVSSANVSAVQN